MNYQATIRTNAMAFHRNFSLGRFDDNGPLVAEDIAVDSNNVIFSGRDKFVERIKRYEGPFPGLKMTDRYIVTDGDKVGVQYLLQGHHKGQFGEHAPTGNKIEVLSGEIFEFDENALMKRLTTVSRLDDLTHQITGGTTIDTLKDYKLLPNGDADTELTASIRKTAAALHKNLSKGDFEANRLLVDEDIQVNSNGVEFSGRDKFVQHTQRFETPFPDMQIIDEHVLVEGRRACVSYHMEGTHKGDLLLPDGSVLAPTHKDFKSRGIEFMHFNDQGQLNELLTISNMQDLIGQLQPAG